jgi:RHH-type proline utilization regulon transcriptional repressor/proline dehydrogenase/delta 1-pyrroline-5-carboxylate dehydrogenase
MFEPRRLGRFIGELDEVWYQPKGVAVVIAPWNFPCAIFTGMVTAALVTGNTVIAKPAEQTPGIARLVCDILWEAGVPATCCTTATPAARRWARCSSATRASR